FLIMYLLKNLLITGCLAYPLYFTCFESITWGSGVLQAELRYYHLSAQSKGYLLKLINEGLINNIFDYYKYKDSIIFESPKDYLKNFSWIEYWWKYEYDKNRILNVLLVLIILFLIIFTINFKKFSFKKINLNYIIIFIFFIPIISWFFLLPQSRYGGYAIFFVFLTYFISNIFHDPKFYINPLLVLFMLISLSYFESKNINRIFNSLNSSEVFYDVNPLDKDSTKLLKNRFIIPITIRVFSKNDKLGKPIYCYNTKGICVSSIRLECIKDIRIKNNYITVIPHIKKCSEIIENYLWY
ncbi:hypothetical protein OAO47_00590, partial [bacterium]|nr:hypothetical protein [bacterium]